MKHLLPLLLLLTVSIPSAAQDTHAFSATDLWKLRRVGGLTLAPDGKTAAVVVTAYDLKENRGNGDIWLVDIATGAARQFTTGKTTESSPAWSPDGNRLAFIAKRDDNERAQLYVIDRHGGEARQLTDAPLGVSSPRWFPDGGRIAFVADALPRARGNFDSLRAEIKRRKDTKINANASENRFWRYWDHYLTEGYYSHIYSVEVDSKKVTDLTPDMNRFFNADGGVAFDIAPDCREIAVAALASGEPYDTPLATDVYLVPTDGSGAMRDITAANPGDDGDPRYTSDGRYILFGRTLDPRRNAERTRLMRHDRASGAELELCPGFDRNPGDWRTGDGGGLVYFLAEDVARNSVFSVPIDGGTPRRLFHDGVNSGLACAGGAVAFLHQDSRGPNEVFVLDGRGARALTHFNDSLLAGIAFGRKSEAWYRGARGDSVQMFIITPPGFDPKKKWPMVVVLHGGPHGTSADDFHFRWNAQLFAAPGYVVITPNFHGSTSFGEEFADCINGAHPAMPFEDVMRAVDFMLAQGWIDSTRMAVTGGSYGGYLTTWIGGHTDRFACLIDHAGPYNLMAQYGSDVTHNRDVSYGGTPWAGRDTVLKWSPSQYAASFNTPTLVMHGEKDYRVPVNQGLELYGMLKARGVPARIVVFPEENHWIQSPANSIFWYNEFHAWLARWIGAGK